MKQILLIGATDAGNKNEVGLLAESLRLQQLDAEVRTCYWEDLLFTVSNDKQAVVDAVSGNDIAGFDLVLCMNWYKTGNLSFYRDIAFTLALYLQHAGTAFWNSEMLNQRSATKISAMMQLALEGVSIPASVFSLNHEALAGALPAGYPAIVKTIAGSRGAHNHLVQNAEELRSVLARDGARVPFMVQEFIPNDHDLRVVCYGGKPALVIKRSRTSDQTHLNNTSQGAEATIVPLAQVDQTILQTCQRACEILGRELAGVDIVLANDGSQRMVCLEVNAIPQLTSGSYLPEKAETLATALNEFVKGAL